jgi:hypothetical protein
LLGILILTFQTYFLAAGVARGYSGFGRGFAGDRKLVMQEYNNSEKKI